MRKGFLIYEERRKYFPIYEEAVCHIWLCNCSILNFLINEEKLIFFFISVAHRRQFFASPWFSANQPMSEHAQTYVNTNWTCLPYPSSVRMTKESLPKPDLIANLIFRKIGSLRHSGFSFSFLALYLYMVLSVHS